MSTSGSIDWPLPEAVFEWIGESELSRDGQSNAILGVSATAVVQCYTRWYNFHREIVSKMDMMAIDLQAANKEKKGVSALKMRITTLEKEVGVLRDESTKYRGQADKRRDTESSPTTIRPCRRPQMPLQECRTPSSKR